MMKGIFNHYKNIIAYLFFGVCTTIVNIVTYLVCARIFLLTTVISTIIAWLISVTFAFVTNKAWVFDSRLWKKNIIIREIISFFLCRLGTGILDLLIMFVSVDIMKLEDITMKVISNVLVIILNYIASKFVIFRS